MTCRATANSTPIDYQTPELKKAPSATNLVLHNDRTKKFEIGSKKTPSLGRLYKMFNALKVNLFPIAKIKRCYNMFCHKP